MRKHLWAASYVFAGTLCATSEGGLTRFPNWTAAPRFGAAMVTKPFSPHFLSGVIGVEPDPVFSTVFEGDIGGLITWTITNTTGLSCAPSKVTVVPPEFFSGDKDDKVTGHFDATDGGSDSIIGHILAPGASITFRTVYIVSDAHPDPEPDSGTWKLGVEVEVQFVGMPAFATGDGTALVTVRDRPVPEPAGGCLLAMAGAIGARRRRARSAGCPVHCGSFPVRWGVEVSKPGRVGV